MTSWVKGGSPGYDLTFSYFWKTQGTIKPVLNCCDKHFVLSHRLVFPTSLGTLQGWGFDFLIGICVPKPKHSAWYENTQGVSRGRTKDRCFSFLPQFPRLCQFHLHIQHDALLSLLLVFVSESQRKGQCPPPLPPRTAPPWPKNRSQMFSSQCLDKKIRENKFRKGHATLLKF